MSNNNSNTNQIVREAMKLVSKDVRAPQVVRQGTVKPTVKPVPKQK
jgi:hypothetical protein